MKYTVQAIIEYFERQGILVKQGTIENFRSKLFDFGILKNNQSMSAKHLEVFEKIVSEKTDSVTWESLMLKHIFSDLSQEINSPFRWTDKIIIRDLIWKLNRNQYHVFPFELCSDSDIDDCHVFNCIIDNFVELGKIYPEYQSSQGSDGNPITSYKIQTEDGRYYYLIGKLNPLTKHEDVHLFYNNLPFFDVMACRHITSGNCDDGPFHELWVTCHKCLTQPLGTF